MRVLAPTGDTYAWIWCCGAVGRTFAGEQGAALLFQWVAGSRRYYVRPIFIAWIFGPLFFSFLLRPRRDRRCEGPMYESQRVQHLHFVGLCSVGARTLFVPGVAGFRSDIMLHRVVDSPLRVVDSRASSCASPISH